MRVSRDDEICEKAKGLGQEIRLYRHRQYDAARARVELMYGLDGPELQIIVNQRTRNRFWRSRHLWIRSNTASRVWTIVTGHQASGLLITTDSRSPTRRSFPRRGEHYNSVRGHSSATTSYLTQSGQLITKHGGRVGNPLLWPTFRAEARPRH